MHCRWVGWELGKHGNICNRVVIIAAAVILLIIIMTITIIMLFVIPTAL